MKFEEGNLKNKFLKMNDDRIRCSREFTVHFLGQLNFGILVFF